MLVSGIFIGLQESRSLAETSQGLFWGGGGEQWGVNSWTLLLEGFPQRVLTYKRAGDETHGKVSAAKRSLGKIGKVA